MSGGGVGGGARHDGEPGLPALALGGQLALVLGATTLGERPPCGAVECRVGRPAARFGVEEVLVDVGRIEFEPPSDRCGVGEPGDAHGVQDQQIERGVLAHESASCRAVSRV